MEVSTVFTYYATNEVILVYIRVELSRFITQLVQMKSIHTLLTCYYNSADEGGTQSATFMCYITMEPKLYCPVRWDFAIVQNEGNFIQYSGCSYNCWVASALLIAGFTLTLWIPGQSQFAFTSSYWSLIQRLPTASLWLISINASHVMTMLFELSEQWQPEEDKNQYSPHNFATRVSVGT